MLLLHVDSACANYNFDTYTGLQYSVSNTQFSIQYSVSNTAAHASLLDHPLHSETKPMHASLLAYQLLSVTVSLSLINLSVTLL